MLIKNILNFLYPPSCRSCNVLVHEKAIFCVACSNTIKPIVSLIVPLTGKHQMTVFAVSAYQDPVKNLMLKKFSQDIVASKQLGNLMIQMSSISDVSIDYIVPIPLHWTRYARRGFNQAQEMACVVALNLKRPVINFLKRNKRTTFQSKLSVEERQENVKNAFVPAWRYKRFNRDLLLDKNILLIDDLCTTGSTLKSAAKALLEFKPKSITALVACRAVQ